MKPKALYILADFAYDLIYGQPERDEIATLVNLIGPQQNAQSIAENPDLLADVEIILSGWGAPKLDESFLQAAPKLKAFLYGAGSVRNFTTEAFWDSNAILTSSYAANAIPVVEYTISTIFLSLKRFWAFADAIKRSGTYVRKQQKPDEVAGGFGSTVGLISLGMIGRLVAKRLQPFDLNVIAYDPFVTQAEAEADDLQVTMVDTLEEIFTRSDVVSLHTPWLPETVGMITGEHLAAMKPETTFINTARGAVVREEEMIAVLQQRPDLYAILDVVYPEPPAPDNPLLTMPNVVLTPHIAGTMGPECRRMGQLVIAELKHILQGETPTYHITREKAAILA